MAAVVGLMLLLGVSQGLRTYCDGRQDRAQCYGALGGTVDVQLMDSALETYRYWWKKDQRVILDVRIKRIVVNLLEDRSLFTPSDGTFRINNLSRNDGGEYQLNIYDLTRRKLENRTLHLTIQAPVWSVLLVSECLCEGQMRASCSSEGGDSPQYSWTLDGHTLTHAELLSGNTESNSITLKQHVSGRLACSVRNQVSHGFKEETITDCETYCDGRQDGAQCYGALGGTVDVQLMDSALGIYRYWWRKNQRVILDGIKNRILSNLQEDRSLFTPSNGTFRINNLNRNDSGEYDLELIDPDGKIKQRTLHLTIQAPVWSVLLVSECLSEGQMRVSCSSEGGDSPQYSWTLDGRTLTHAELLSGNTESNSIILKQHVSGRLVCSVRNQVSHVSKEETITDCGFIFINCTSSDGTHISQWVFAATNTLCFVPATTRDRSLLICGVRAAVVVLLLIGITAYFALRKANSNKAEGSAATGTREHQENSVLMVEL